MLSLFRPLLLLPLVLSLQLQAQNSAAWEPGRKAPGRTKEQASTTVSGLQSWKRHLRQWGLDSSYNRSLGIGGRLNSNGWSGLVAYGCKDERGRLRLWQLSMSEVKHEKETRLQGGNGGFTELGSGTPYIYGKQYNLYLLQLTYSRERAVLPAVLDGNVGIGFRYGGGLSLALLKPYSLRLIYPDYATMPPTASIREERYDAANSERFLNPSLISGRGRWSDGLDAMRYVPGIHGECAIVISPATGRSFAQEISLGAQGSVYAEPLPILVQNDASRFRICLVAGLELGKRWKQ